MAENGRRSVRISARTVEKAIERGLAALGVSREEAEIVIIEEGSRGVLGIGAEDAVVTISVAAPPSLPHVVVEAEEPQQPPEAESEAGDDLAQIAKDTLQALLDHMAISARVELAEKAPSTEAMEDSVALNVTGDNLGLLIGRRGETLRDLQFITRLIVSRQIERWPTVIVDVEYYKARREKLLTDLARRMAERVRLNQKPLPLEPMPAYERRIIHLALRNLPGVYTESTGEGQARKVVIFPKP